MVLRRSKDKLRVQLTSRFDYPEILEYDGAFSGSSSQSEVFSAVAEPLLAAAAAGKSATVITYGASGTGKTYTMFGDLLGGSHGAGLVPRTMRALWSRLPKPLAVRMSLLRINNDVSTRKSPPIHFRKFLS